MAIAPRAPWNLNLIHSLALKENECFYEYTLPFKEKGRFLMIVQSFMLGILVFLCPEMILIGRTKFIINNRQSEKKKTKKDTKFNFGNIRKNCFKLCFMENEKVVTM